MKIALLTLISLGMLSGPAYARELPDPFLSGDQAEALFRELPEASAQADTLCTANEPPSRCSMAITRSHGPTQCTETADTSYEYRASTVEPGHYYVVKSTTTISYSCDTGVR